MAHARQFVNALGASPAALPAMAGDPSWVPMPGAPRVLMVVHMFPPYWFAGVEVHTLHLAQALRARGCDVSVFFPLVMPDQSGFYLVKGHYAGVPVHALSHGGRGSKLFNHEWPELDGEFSALLARERYDVVHFQHSIGLSFRMFDIARESGARTCLTLHDFWMMCQRVHFYVESEHRMCEGPETAAKCAACAIGPAWAGMEAARKSAAESLFAQRAEINKRIFAGLDVITAPTRYVQRKLEQFGYADPRRIEIRSLGLRPVARKQRAPRGGPLRFAFLGTIHPLKNVFMLSKAFGDVLGEASLAFHGEGKIEHVERLRESVKADARQSYAGKYVPADLGDILAEVDVVVICSITENYPLVAREALSAGVPVIGSRAGGIPEIIEDGVSGLLFDPAKPQQLTACIQRLVDQPDLVAELRGKIPAVKTMEEEAAEWAERYARLQASALSPRPTAGLPVHR